MIYKSMMDCVRDLERKGHLVRISREMDPELEMAEVHRRVYEAGGPALFFENVKGSCFPAVSNLFGTYERARFIFRSTIEEVKKAIELKADPGAFFKDPMGCAGLPMAALNAVPWKRSKGPVLYGKTEIETLPQIKCWPEDGGAFVLLPQVYSEDPEKPGIMNSNMGMYRVQLSGNDYQPGKEVGLHYQIRRDIGIHHKNALKKGEPLKVSIFVGGPPAHTFAAVMPLPEHLPEVAFAGALAGRRFRYAHVNGHTISLDADFVITGTVLPCETRPEGPFGDHLGYYSLTHEFPFLKVDNVYYRKDAVWPFTVVGRPPQEDTLFGRLIHEMTGPMVPVSIPGVTAVHAVDSAGVHPLLLATGRETFEPGEKTRPSELLTLANAILGFSHCSLAKYLFICAHEDQPDLDIYDEEAYFSHVLKRVDWTRDLHFQTQTTMDTLDYSGTGLNTGSKLVVAARGQAVRDLGEKVPYGMKLPRGFKKAAVASPGILVIQAPKWSKGDAAVRQVENMVDKIDPGKVDNFPMIVLVDDSEFASRNFGNFLWVTFTRSNPSHDIYGVGSFVEHKHWGCRGSLVIDARLKAHHASPLVEDPKVTARVDALGVRGGALEGLI